MQEEDGSGRRHHLWGRDGDALPWLPWHREDHDGQCPGQQAGQEGWPHLSPGLGDPFVWCAQVLLINFPSLGSMTAGENFKFIFREAKINDAILFFDECEAIFETREKGGHDVNTLLTEIERFVPYTVGIH